MSTTKYDIANIALRTLLFKQAISDFTSTPQGIIMGDVYEHVKVAELRKHSWNFAIKKTTLTNNDWVTLTSYAVGDIVEYDDTLYKCLTAHTSGTFATDLAASKWEEAPAFTEYAYIHKLPLDFLRALQVDEDVEAQYEINSTHIESDYETLKLKYIYEAAEDNFSEEFILVLALALAKEVCYAITNDHTRQKELEYQYYQKQIEAINIDSMQNPLRKIDNTQSSWITSRL